MRFREKVEFQCIFADENPKRIFTKMHLDIYLDWRTAKTIEWSFVFYYAEISLEEALVSSRHLPKRFFS